MLIDSKDENDMKIYVADTHSLVWFIAEDKRLSERAKRLLERAEDAQVQILIPTVVLAEITYIAQKKRVEVTIHDVLKLIEQKGGFVVVPFDLLIFQTMLQLPSELEIHDRIIGATARHHKAILITKDAALHNSGQVKTAW